LAAQQPLSALVVDPDPLFVSQLAPIVTSSGYRLIPVTEFAAARSELYVHKPAVLVTNVRLGAFNGIHLVYLAKINKPDTHVMVYGESDHLLAREIQSAGGFYERMQFVPYALAGFLMGVLPVRDRRDVGGSDRRHIFRGGRRTTDLPILHAPAVL
jgi:hypothetical protein